MLTLYYRPQGKFVDPAQSNLALPKVHELSSGSVCDKCLVYKLLYHAYLGKIDAASEGIDNE